MSNTDAPATIVIIGAGPRGTGLLERLVANAPELLGARELLVHVIDPHPFGAGQIWRSDQSPLLWANSMAQDMTMFTDPSCQIEGPIVPGPHMGEWIASAAASPLRDPGVNRELATLTGTGFPSRRLVNEYLAWTFWRSVHWARSGHPAGTPRVSVEVHPERALDLVELPHGRQGVVLTNEQDLLEADLVMLALGHLGSEPLGPSRQFAQAAEEYKLHYLPESYAADADLSAFGPGDDVLVRGLGLDFIDLMVLLTQARGGHFEEQADGRLTYRASGNEPRLHVGSRRGVPYRSKLGYDLQAPLPEPRFFTVEAVTQLLAGAGPIGFEASVWPLLLREMTFGYYHELFLGHPDRVARPWAQFLEGLSSLCAEDLFPEPVSTDSGALPTDLPALNALVATAVPDPADRFDLPRFDRPLTGTHFDSAADLQSWVRGHVEADLTRRGDSRYSGDLGAFMSLLRAFGPFSRLLESGRLSLHSQLNDLPRFMNFFSYLASGPPPRRLRELVALSEAGIVTFLGAGSRIWVDRDPAATPVGFAASSVSVPGTVRAAALIEARIPRPSIIHTTDPLVRALHARGELGEQALQDAGTGLSVSTGRVMVTSTFQVIDAAGVPHPRRLAFGAWTSAATAAAFSRPGTNAPFFVQNDAAARQVLRLLQNEIREPVAGTEPAEAAGRRHQGRRGVRAGGVGRGPELRFVSADDPAIPGLLAKIDHEYAGRYPSLSHTTDDAVPLSLLQPPDGALLLAFEDGVCVAAGAFKRYEHAPRTAEIKRVWTDRSQRGRGLARRLLSGLEEEAWQRGYRQVHLTTGPRQPEAQALYLTSGYTPLFDLDSDPELIGLLPFEKSLADADRGSGG